MTQPPLPIATARNHSGMEASSAIVRACRLGMFVQAMVINLAPLLFVQLHAQFGLTWEMVGRLVLINFLTQLAVDLAGSRLIAACGLRPLCVAAHVAAFVGLLVFATAPLAGGYAMLVAGTVVFSAGCGLLEVLMSPILDAVPSQRKAGDMALLHAFYPIGKLAVIVGTAVALVLIGPGGWPWVVVAWSLVPVVGIWLFATIPLPSLDPGGRRVRARDLLRSGGFRLALLAMVFAGATEVAFAQWTSAFAQHGLGVSQAVADLVGFGLFAVGMAAGRLWFGMYGVGHNLVRTLSLGAAASAAVYLLAALSPWPVVSLAACACAGLAVSMLWPGTLSFAAARWPVGGAVVFAAMAAAGDGGCAVGPWLVGLAADAAGDLPALAGWLPGASAGTDSAGLRLGMLVGAAAPIALLFCAWRLARRGEIERHPACHQP